MSKRPLRRRQRTAPVYSMVEFLEREIEQLHDSIATLERESTAHTRRCAEMQVEIDVLKKTVTGLTR